MAPYIGIVGNIDKNKFGTEMTVSPITYANCVERAGGIPIILPITENTDILSSLIELSDGFLFQGGIDVNPLCYNEEATPQLGEISDLLDRFHIKFLELAVETKKPIMGICRGAQIINVAFGGTLYQDIPSMIGDSALKHTQDVISFDTDHKVTFEKGSRLFNLFGETIEINSRHHQSIKKAGKGFEITGKAPDGVVEAAQHSTLPIDLIQWHPELMMQKNDDMLPLFELLVNRCDFL